MRVSSSAVHSAHRTTSPWCTGRALMLGIARYAFSSSTYRSRWRLMKSTTVLVMGMGGLRTTDEGLRHGWVFDGQIQAIAPLAPRAEIIADVRVSEQPQRQI